MANRLDGRRALVTGAASGIGRAIAEAYSDEGAKVALLDVARNRLKDVAATIDGETLPIECDVRETTAVRAAVDRTVEQWSGIDIVVNNAGVIVRKELVDISDDEIEQLVDINLNGALRVARATIPQLKQSEGSLINMSSIVSVEGLPDRSIYSATKGGLKSLTHQLAVELAPTVRVNAIAPGTIDTPLNERVRSDENYAEQKVATIPLERVGNPEEIAGPAVFLASGEASYVTGHVLFADGGRSVS